MIPVVPTWLWGVALCVLSNCLTALGLVTQKLAHLQVEQSGGKSRYFKQPWWMAGMAAFVLGQVANIPAMALTPQTMLSCLGGLSLVFNSAYAHVLLGERLRSSEVLVMLAMVIGAGMVVSVTPVPKTHHESTQIFGALLHRAFLLTAVGVTAFLGVLGLLAYFVATPLKPFFLGLTCAACGSYGMTFFKCGAEVISSTSRWWLNLELYMLGIIALGICAVQIHTMNLGLRIGEVVTIIPTFFALGVLFALVQAELAFGELNELRGAHNIVIFVVGVVLVLGATVALLLLHRQEEEPEDLETERLPLLHRKAGSEPTLQRSHWSLNTLSPLGLPRTSFDNIHELTLLSVTGPMGVA
ncbi:unnamed protein product [Effrenium voratum]|nr:unnamed protein product [Effrenium voratum]